MTASAIPSSRPLVGKPGLARELDTTTRTIDRWARDPDLHFPSPITMKWRVYFLRDEIEEAESDGTRHFKVMGGAAGSGGVS